MNLLGLLENYNINPQNSTYIITSDHGEQLMEYGGFRHGLTLEREEYEIPILFYGFGIQYKPNMSRIAVHQDIVPTILHLADINYADKDYVGRNLLDDFNEDSYRTYYIINPIDADTYKVKAVNIIF